MPTYFGCSKLNESFFAGIFKADKAKFLVNQFRAFFSCNDFDLFLISRLRC